VPWLFIILTQKSGIRQNRDPRMTYFSA